MKKISNMLTILLLLSLVGCTQNKSIVVTTKNTYGTNQYNAFLSPFVCTQDDYIYYVPANTFRGIRRYNASDKSDVKIAGSKLYESLKVSGDYIYASSLSEFGGVDNGIYKIKTDGKEVKQILSGFSINRFNICNDIIYFSTDSGLYSADADGEKPVCLINGSIDTFFVSEDEIYYYMYKDYFLGKYNCATSENTIIIGNKRMRRWMIKDNVVYYVPYITTDQTYYYNMYTTIYSYNMSSLEEKVIYEYLSGSFVFTIYNNSIWIIDDVRDKELNYLYSKIVSISLSDGKSAKDSVNTEGSEYIILNHILYIYSSDIYESNISDLTRLHEVSSAEVDTE